MVLDWESGLTMIQARGIRPGPRSQRQLFLLYSPDDSGKYGWDLYAAIQIRWLLERPGTAD